jgi:hypothetical protein
MIERTLELYELVGPEQFERTLVASVQGVGSVFVPNDASDFIKMLDLSVVIFAGSLIAPGFIIVLVWTASHHRGLMALLASKIDERKVQ